MYITVASYLAAVKLASTMLVVGTFRETLVFPYGLFNPSVLELETGLRISK